MVFIFLLLIIIVLITFSKINIEIENFIFTSETKRHINTDYKIVLRLLILSKLPILKINISKTKLEKMQLKEKIKNIDVKILENNIKFDKNLIKVLKNLHVGINNFELKLELGTENASFTAIIVPVISTVLSIFLQNKVKKIENQKFIINPVFINQNLINIVFSGIFEIRMIHIINIIYILIKKKGVKKHERTSNRRPYDYSYE